MRLAEYQALNQIYITLNKMFRKKKGWSIYILTADSKFPRYFKRGRPDRVRKLYNGTIEVNYYQYYGEKPPE
jgi:putative N6-adenine-specific DNA methylase